MPPTTRDTNLWTIAQRRLDEAAERLQLDDGMRRVLRVPKRELTVSSRFGTRRTRRMPSSSCSRSAASSR